MGRHWTGNSPRPQTTSPTWVCPIFGETRPTQTGTFFSTAFIQAFPQAAETRATTATLGASHVRLHINFTFSVNLLAVSTALASDSCHGGMRGLHRGPYYVVIHIIRQFELDPPPRLIGNPVTLRSALNVAPNGIPEVFVQVNQSHASQAVVSPFAFALDQHPCLVDNEMNKTSVTLRTTVNFIIRGMFRSSVPKSRNSHAS